MNKYEFYQAFGQQVQDKPFQAILIAETEAEKAISARNNFSPSKRTKRNLGTVCLTDASLETQQQVIAWLNDPTIKITHGQGSITAVKTLTTDELADRNQELLDKLVAAVTTTEAALNRLLEAYKTIDLARNNIQPDEFFASAVDENDLNILKLVTSL